MTIWEKKFTWHTTIMKKSDGKEKNVAVKEPTTPIVKNQLYETQKIFDPKFWIKRHVGNRYTNKPDSRKQWVDNIHHTLEHSRKTEYCVGDTENFQEKSRKMKIRFREKFLSCRNQSNLLNFQNKTRWLLHVKIVLYDRINWCVSNMQFIIYQSHKFFRKIICSCVNICARVYENFSIENWETTLKLYSVIRF